MHKQRTASGIDKNALMEESVFLRVHELQNGLVQLTDATTARRMVTEFGNDIRYIAPWKKWIVWNDTRWEADSGALIHTKCLEIVRNIYAEISKTADYRERMDIEKYAVKSESINNPRVVVLVRYLSQGLRPFAYNPAAGKLCQVGAVYSRTQCGG